MRFIFSSAFLFVTSLIAVNAETHALQPYAYVRAYGVNAVDTGCYATKDTKFILDYEYSAELTTKMSFMGANNASDANHSIYDSTAKKLSCILKGKWGNAFDAEQNTRYVSVMDSAAGKMTTTGYDRTPVNTSSPGSLVINDVSTTFSTYLFYRNNHANDESPANGKIYSFEMDAACEMKDDLSGEEALV